MDKYYKEKTFEGSRKSKNKEIYVKHMEEAFEDLNLTSNISVIDADIENLDLEKLKEYLNERYKTEEKPKIDAIEEIEKEEEEELIDTKEYDLKRIIEEARKNKETDYDKDRFKKLRDTQYDILKNLNIEKTGELDVKSIEENSDEASSEDDGKEHTLFEDLIGGEDTEVIAPVEEEKLATEEIKDFVEENIEKLEEKETKKLEKLEELEDSAKEKSKDDDKKPSLNEELEKTLKLSRKQIEEAEAKEEEKIEEDLTNTEKNLLNNTFYTGKYQIKESDLDGFDDLKKELKTGNMLARILIIILVIIVFAIVFFLVDKYMHLGFFIK